MITKAYKARRRFVIGAAAIPVLLRPGYAPAQSSGPSLPSANEELMQEHGLVSRVFGVYRAAINHLNAKREFEPKLVAEAARMVNDVIHRQHEQEEEKTLFPRVAQGASVEMQSLIRVLLGQHQAARPLTAMIEKNMASGKLKDSSARQETITAMQKFIDMYEPHGAYENTVVYPVFRKKLTAQAYSDLSKEFADDKFDQYTAQLSRIEMLLNVNLAQKTEQKDR